MNRIKIGIVGTGSMANAHATAFKAIRGVEIESCFDILPERSAEFRARHGIRQGARSLEELIDKCDAVSVVTPDAHHASISVQALRAGRHLLCEKPLTATLDEARRVAAAAKKAAAKGVRSMINFTYRRAAAFERAGLLARQGKLGDLRHVQASYLQTWLSAPVWGHWTREAWIWRLEGREGPSGVLGDLGCHILDLVTGIAGPCRRVRCELRTFPKLTVRQRPVSRWRGRPLDASDTALIELELENGAVGVVQTTRWATGHKNHIRFEASGTRGAVRFDLDQSTEAVEACIGKDVESVTWRTHILRPARSVHERFIRSIRTGVPEEPSLLRGAEIQACLDACSRSAASGRGERFQRVT